MNDQIRPNKSGKSPGTSVRSGNSSVVSSQPKSAINFNRQTHNLNQSSGPMNAQVFPPGLEYLVSINELKVKQKIHMFEVLTCCERKNEYTIENRTGQIFYNAKEVSGFCDRLCCSQYRAFDMEIMDNKINREVLHLRRPFGCDCFLCFCCLQEMEVEAPRGNVIGYVRQDCSYIFPAFHLEDSQRQTILAIEGPCITCSLCCQDVIFDVFTAKNRIKIGEIAKLWSGCCRETFTDADFFKVTFPMDLDINMKATLLAAAFLIDYVYFER